MSNLATGKKVRLKSTGEIGVIKDIERVKRQTGEMEDVTYLVKLCGKAGWVQTERKHLELVSEPKKTPKRLYPKVYVREETLQSDGRTISVVGIVDVLSLPTYDIINKEISQDKRKCKMLSVAYAICHPDDKYDRDYAVKLATERCYSRPMAEYSSPQSGEFRDDIVNAILQVKCDYIKNNIEKFTKRR